MRTKKAIPQKYHGNYRRYSPEILLKAVDEVKLKKTSIRRVALQYNIPYQTLRDRISGRVDPNNFTTEKVFTKEEELGLVEYAEDSARLGYGFSNTAMQKMAGELALHLGKRATDKSLSNCWLYGFLKRWDTRISTLKPSALDSNRAKHSTPEIINKYFENLELAITELGLQRRPDCIYNLDETGISPEHRPPNIIAPINEKAQAVTSPRSATTTLIACASASGHHLPPYFVFKGKRSNDNLSKDLTPGAIVTMSETGWSTSATFKDYLENHFLRHINRGDGSQPVLLLLDGHSTHTSPEMVKWARDRHIHLFCLPAHTSHVLQPLDVGVFGPFKRFYYSECALYMKVNPGKIVTKYEIAGIACKAYLKAICPWNVVSAFRKTGVHPLNRNAVPMEKLLPCEAFRDATPMLKMQSIRAGKQAVDEYLRAKSESVSTTVPFKIGKQKSTTQKPKPGGKLLTSDEYVEALEIYDSQKQNKASTSTHLPTTSGLTTNRTDSYESESDVDDSEVCCVCERFTPINVDKRPHLKIVSWGQCDECGHLVHLSFCHAQSVIRRGDSFLCPHCS